jgi:transposase
MRDHEMYAAILGIQSPWRVESVELQLESGEVHIHLGHGDGQQWPCPECGTLCRLYGHQAERRWRHLDTCQYRTILHAEPPRTECPDHGAKVVRLPWAEAGSRFTALFEALAICWLKSASQPAVADLLRLSWDEMHGIMDRAVARGLERRAAEPIPHVGVDEKAFRKGHSYVTLVNDLNRNRVLYVAEERKRSSMNGFLATLTPEQIASIEAVAMDMWDPYVSSTREYLPAANSKIVFDKFLVAKHLSESVDQVRRREQKTLKAAGDDRITGTGYDWLSNRAAMTPEDRRAFDVLRQSGLKTARTWALKETAMSLYSYVYERPARKHFRWRWNWAQRSLLEPIKRVARMLKRRFENVITCLRHRITNAGSESLNAKIQWVKYRARLSQSAELHQRNILLLRRAGHEPRTY